tara:strand:+ start:2031 stop:2369 length:339 start_codon:yes stop_codon:yes gene_type:complete
MKSENEIQREGLDYAESLGVEITRTNAGKVKVRGGWMQLCKKGWSDATGYNQKGQIVLIEFKDEKAWSSKNHGASKEQLERLLDCRSKGGLAGIACSNEHIRMILDGNYDYE